MASRWLGRLLRGVQAGEEHLAWNEVGASESTGLMRLTSPAFAHGMPMPKRFGGPGVGKNVSPALAWADVPADAVELVLIMEDPGAPLPRPFVHAVAFGVSPLVTSIAEGRLSSPWSFHVADALRMGRTSIGKSHYSGPRPPPGHGEHSYVFQLFALKRRLWFWRPPFRWQVVQQMRGAVIARARLDGLFEQ